MKIYSFSYSQLSGPRSSCTGVVLKETTASDRVGEKLLRPYLYASMDLSKMKPVGSQDRSLFAGEGPFPIAVPGSCFTSWLYSVVSENRDFTEHERELASWLMSIEEKGSFTSGFLIGVEEKGEKNTNLFSLAASLARYFWTVDERFRRNASVLMRDVSPQIMLDLANGIKGAGFYKESVLNEMIFGYICAGADHSAAMVNKLRSASATASRVSKLTPVGPVDILSWDKQKVDSKDTCHKTVEAIRGIQEMFISALSRMSEIASLETTPNVRIKAA